MAKMKENSKAQASRLLIAVSTVILLVIIGICFYWFMLRPDSIKNKCWTTSANKYSSLLEAELEGQGDSEVELSFDRYSKYSQGELEDESIADLLETIDSLVGKDYEECLSKSGL